MKQQAKAIIIGGGIMGGSIALELSKKGIISTILDKGAFCSESTTASAGMLGSQVELHQPGPFFELCQKSLSFYPEWVNALEEKSHISLQYIDQGILRVAFTEEDEIELKSRIPWIGGVEWLITDEIRSIEPAISDHIRGGLFFSRDHQIHPSSLAKALRSALIEVGCTIKEWTPVNQFVIKAEQVAGVRTSEGELNADYIIVAAGAWSAQLLTQLNVELPVFPIKGQCYSLQLDKPMIQKTVFTKGCYVVPRLDGSVTIGATEEIIGFQKNTTLSAMAHIHEKAVQMLPALQDASFLSTWAGLRPGSKDGLPYIGRLPHKKNVFIATGHYRNGILLAPITAKLISEIITEQPLSIDIAAYDPMRSIL